MSKLAIDGGAPVRRKPFPTWPIFDEREEQHLLDVLHSGQWGVLTGSKVITFEQRFAEYQGARYGICVPNGTLGLEMALQALGVGPGDEAITTPYTFIATASSVLMTGARPVFADIDLDTYNIDPAQVEQTITERTKVILPVHIGGQPADMDALLAIAQRHDLRLLEDACQSWGAEWQGHRVGAIGDLGAFSFQASKNISAGEGGIVVTNDEELAELCWSLHNVGRVRGGLWYQHERLGWNLRMTEWQGAVLLAQLERLPEQAARREANAHYLSKALSEVPGISPLPDDPRVTRHARHLFIMRYDPAHFSDHSRDEFIEALRAEGIEPCSPGYVPLNRSPAIRRAFAEQSHDNDSSWPLAGDGLPKLPSCPNAEHASQHTIWLPQYVFLGNRADMDSIVEAMTKIQEAW